MKYLSDYMEAAQTELFKKTDTFFAFSTKQFNEQKTEGVKYTALDGGMVCRSENVKELIDGLENIYRAAIAQDLQENGKSGVIKRELYNHESFYTWDYSAAFDAVSDYGITKDEVKAMFYKLA